jgi:hypothetical protein
MADWLRMRDELMDCYLETATEAQRALASGITLKRPDGWAVNWRRRRVRILEFTRCNDCRSDWRKTTEEYKTTLYQPATLVQRCLTELNELYKTCSTAL